MFSYDWENLLISAVNGLLQNMLCITTSQPVSVQLLSVAGVRNIWYGFWNGLCVILILLNLTDRRTKDHKYLQSHQLLLTRTEPWTVGDLWGAGSTLKTLPSYKVSFLPMEARSLPDLVWSSDDVLGGAFPLILLSEYEPASNCSYQRDSTCQHPDYDIKDLRMLDPTLMWGQDSSCMPGDTQLLHLFTYWTCSRHKSTWDSPLPSMPWQPQAIPKDKGRNTDRYHLPHGDTNLLPFCNFMLYQSTSGLGEWQWQRLNCPGLQDLVLKSLVADPHIAAWKHRIFTKKFCKTFSLDFWILC